MKMKSIILTGLLWLSAPAAHADEALLNRAAGYLNTLTTVKTTFTQIAPDGHVATGSFYLKRPGRMRFEYNPPVPVVMVSTGLTLTYHDTELDQITTLPLDDSLAGFLAKEHINFTDKSLEILSAAEEAGILTIHLRQKERPDEGELKLEFTTAPMELKRFITTDANGQETTITLGDAAYGIALDRDLFQPPRKSVFKNRRKK